MSGKKHEGDLNDYNKMYVRCRGLRAHTWQFRTDFNITTGVAGRLIEFTRTLSCVSCTCKRLDRYKVDREGKFHRDGQPRYEYADGYVVSKHNPIAADVARDALFMQEMEMALDNELVNRLRAQQEKAAKKAKPKRTEHLRAVGE